MTLQSDPHLVWRRFLDDIFHFKKQKMWNVAVDGMPLNWFKPNQYNTYGLSDRCSSWWYAFTDLNQTGITLTVYLTEKLLIFTVFVSFFIGYM